MEKIIENIKNGIDCNLYFFVSQVAEPTMYLILIGSVLLIIAGYVALCRFRKGRESKKDEDFK